MNPLNYGLLITSFGIAIVFLVLITLWGILAMMKLFFGGKNKNDGSQDSIKDNSVQGASIVQSEQQSAGDDELIAVIMAAINASLGSQSNLVVKRITRVGDSTPVWGQIGRQEQMFNRL